MGPCGPWKTSGSSPSSSTAPAPTAACTWPTWAPRSSRSRTPPRAATSPATSRPSTRARTACSSRRSTGTSAASRLDLAKPAGPGRLRGPGAGQRRRLLQPAGRRPRQAADHATTTSRHLNPAIVCCSLSGFGMTGPRRAERGYDYILQGLAGWMSLTGEPDGPPTKSGLSMVDFSRRAWPPPSPSSPASTPPAATAWAWTATSACSTPPSRLLSYPATWHLTGGLVPERLSRSAHPSVVPFQNLPTARRLDRRRLPQGEVLRPAGRGRWAGPSWPPIPASATSPPAGTTATSWWPSSTPSWPGRRLPPGWSA